MESVKKNLKRAWNYVFTLIKWVVIAAVTGGVGGLVGTAFHISVEKVTELREANSWLIFLLPVGGLLIAGDTHDRNGTSEKTRIRITDVPRGGANLRKDT